MVNSRLAPSTPHDATASAEEDATFGVPPIARAVIRLIRLVPTLVTLGFAGWALAAAVTGEGAIAAAAALMSLLALSVAVKSTCGAGKRF